jgi:hypothetical protein
MAEIAAEQSEAVVAAACGAGPTEAIVAPGRRIANRMNFIVGVGCCAGRSIRSFRECAVFA